MKNFKSHFEFSKRERSGIFFLLALVIIFQGIYFYTKASPKSNSKVTLNTSEQRKVDSLKAIVLQKKIPKIFPFNPNFISDYKGYTLGMSPEEIDKLHAFRKLGKFVNSAHEFQKVTKVSDSLLAVISPFFKFPDWVKNTRIKNKDSKKSKAKKESSIQIQDINAVTVNELKTISGIGDKLSARTIKFRDRLNGFLINEQLYDVYGLEIEVANRVLQRFQVLKPPHIKKININVATTSEIAELVYITYPIAKEIVKLRTLNGRIESFNELTLIEGFPSEKLDRIVLYLSL